MRLLPLIVWAAFAAPGISNAEIIVSNAWVRMPVGQAVVTAGYVTLQNTGNDLERLNGVSAQGVAKTEMHRTVTGDSGMMRMRPVESIEIPAGGAIAFRSGGDHLMLMGIEQALEPEGQVKLTLLFEHAGEVTTSAIVARRNPFP